MQLDVDFIDMPLITYTLIVLASLVVDVVTPTTISSKDCHSRFNADVYFIVDASNAVSELYYDFYVIGFVRDFVRRVNIGDGFVRVAVFAYADGVKTVVNFTDNTDRPAVLKKLKKLVYMGGDVTTPAAALRTVAAYKGTLPQSNALQITVIITDKVADYDQRVVAAMTSLRQAMERMIMVSVTHKKAPPLISDMANLLSDIHMVDSYESLREDVINLARWKCPPMCGEKVAEKARLERQVRRLRQSINESNKSYDDKRKNLKIDIEKLKASWTQLNYLLALNERDMVNLKKQKNALHKIADNQQMSIQSQYTDIMDTEQTISHENAKILSLTAKIEALKVSNSQTQDLQREIELLQVKTAAQKRSIQELSLQYTTLNTRRNSQLDAISVLRKDIGLIRGDVVNSFGVTDRDLGEIYEQITRMKQYIFNLTIHTSDLASEKATLDQRRKRLKEQGESLINPIDQQSEQNRMKRRRGNVLRNEIFETEKRLVDLKIEFESVSSGNGQQSPDTGVGAKLLKSRQLQLELEKNISVLHSLLESASSMVSKTYDKECEALVAYSGGTLLHNIGETNLEEFFRKAPEVGDKHWPQGKYVSIYLVLLRHEVPVVQLQFDAVNATSSTWFKREFLKSSYPWMNLADRINRDDMYTMSVTRELGFQVALSGDGRALCPSEGYMLVSPPGRRGIACDVANPAAMIYTANWNGEAADFAYQSTFTADNLRIYAVEPRIYP